MRVGWEAITLIVLGCAFGVVLLVRSSEQEARRQQEEREADRQAEIEKRRREEAAREAEHREAVRQREQIEAEVPLVPPTWKLPRAATRTDIASLAKELEREIEGISPKFEAALKRAEDLAERMRTHIDGRVKIQDKALAASYLEAVRDEILVMGEILELYRRLNLARDVLGIERISSDLAANYRYVRHSYIYSMDRFR